MIGCWCWCWWLHDFGFWVKPEFSKLLWQHSTHLVCFCVCLFVCLCVFWRDVVGGRQEDKKTGRVVETGTFTYPIALLLEKSF